MARAGDELDWDDLRYLLRAIEARTLAGAARAMGVEHTTIGRRLSALERALGAPLVLRGPDGLSLTPLGERVAPLLVDVERAVAAIRELVAAERARVRLAVPSGFTPLFAAAHARLRASRPELSLEIISGARPVDLKRGEADLSIRSGPVTDKELVARKLCVSGFSLYASHSYLARNPRPIDPADLTGHELIGFDPALAGAPPARWIAGHAAGATIVLRSREMTDVLGAALGGVGLAVLPCLLGDAEPALTRVTPDVLATANLSVVYRREARLSDPIRAVIRFVIDTITDHAEAISGAGSAR